MKIGSFVFGVNGSYVHILFYCGHRIVMVIFYFIVDALSSDNWYIKIRVENPNIKIIWLPSHVSLVLNHIALCFLEFCIYLLFAIVSPFYSFAALC